jgi:Zn-dependent protease with chaperone function
MKTNSEEIHESRLDPFAFPSETTTRFILLIISVIGASLFIYSILYWRYLESQGSLESIFNLAQSCLNQNNELSLSTTQLNRAKEALTQCSIPLEEEFRNAALFALGSSGILLCLASILYSLFPILMIWREGLVFLDKDADMEDVVIYLKELCQELNIRAPIFLQKPTSRSFGGSAFGSWGRYYIILPVGLLTLFDTNRDAFRAVLLHELAHLRNKDVDKTYFSVAISCTFGIVAILPFMFSLLNNNWSERFQSIWRVTALALLVYLSFASVIRSREFYADVRASTYPDSQSLSLLLETHLKPKFSGLQATLISALERLPYFRKNNWQYAFLFHPSTSERIDILKRTDRLFKLDLWTTFGTGIAVTVAYESIASLIISLLRNVLGRTDAWLESLGAGFIFAPLVIGIIGLGIWRSTFVTIVRNQHSVEAGKLGIGLGLGMIFGQLLSFDNIVSNQKVLGLEKFDWTMQFTSSAFNILWSVLLLVSLYYFFKWIAVSASVWLRVAIYSRSPYSFYISGLTISGLWLTLWFGIIFLIRNADVYLRFPNSIVTLLSLILIFLPAVIVQITLQPLTLIALVSLWAFPMNACLWRDYITNSTSFPKWGFLDKPPTQLHLQHHKQLQIHYAFVRGLKGGLMYCVLMLALRLGLHFFVPESVRNTDWFKLILILAVPISFAALMQAVIAIKTARRVKNLHSIHGLFSAFNAGCIMTLGILVLNLLFGGTIDTHFAWMIFSLVVNWGSLLCLLGMIFINFPKNQTTVSNSE